MFGLLCSGLTIFSVLFLNNCQTLTQVANSLAKIQFKLQNVTNFKLASIDIFNKRSLSDITAIDGVNLLRAFNSKKFPAEFVLNVAAINPNNSSNTNNKQQATSFSLTSLDWRLLVDDVSTISGDIGSPIQIPSSGKTTIIPLNMSLDLYKFFANKGYEGILNLALAIGGVNNSSSRLKLDAMPTVKTPLGSIKYPNRITIVDKEFR